MSNNWKIKNDLNSKNKVDSCNREVDQGRNYRETNDLNSLIKEGSQI